MPRSTRILVAVISLLVTLGAVSACGTSGGVPRASGSGKSDESKTTTKAKERPRTLSQAVDEASQPPSGKKSKKRPAPEDPPEVDSEEDDDSYFGTLVGILEIASAVTPSQPEPVAPTGNAATDGTPASPDAEEGPEPLHFGVIVGYGTEDGDVFDPARSYGVQLGTRTRRLRGDLQVSWSGPDPKPGTNVAAGLRDLEHLTMDVSGRVYLTPPHVLMGPYALGGARLDLLSWKYRNPVPAGGGDTVEHDSIEAIGGRVGFGISPVQLRHFQLGVNVSLGWKHYAGDTAEGFENDVFKDGGYHEIALEAAYHL